MILFIIVKDGRMDGLHKIIFLIYGSETNLKFSTILRFSFTVAAQFNTSWSEFGYQILTQ